MNILESAEMYLETILILSEKKENVRSIDIAEYMNFSKPSVSRAVNNLKDNLYIDINSNGYITLTPKGLEIASKIYDRHKVISNVLISIGVSEDIAVRDACKMEHDISEETFDAIKKHMKK